MPFAFAERVPSPDQLKTVPTPWAVAGTLTTPVPHTQETTARAVDNGRDSRHRHYYKKHMTMLGLRKELDSSDTDSETSENFQTKLFRRRHHKLKPVKTIAQREQEAIEARRQGRPWEQLVAPLDRIGLSPTMGEDPRADLARLKDGVPRGKRTVGFDEAHARLEGPVRRPEHTNGRQSRAEGHRAAVQTGTSSTSLPAAWDAREAEREQQRLEFRRTGPRPTPDMFKGPPRAPPAPHAGDAATAPSPPRRSHSSMSGATALSITRTVRALRKDHRESMQRHQLIMGHMTGANGPAAPTPLGALVAVSPPPRSKARTQSTTAKAPKAK